nr:efflux transporter outer membrane subunit [Duganella fentianensis]
MLLQATQDNLDLARARAMLRAARARHGLVEASRYPRLGVAASAARAHESANVPSTAQGQPGETDNLFQLGFDANWEIDLFGARQHERDASAADLGAVQDDTAAVRLSVLAEVARNYVQLRGIEAQIALARQSAMTADEAKTLAHSRLTAGIGTESELLAAKADLAAAQAAIEPLDATRKVTQHRLAVLTGSTPGEIERELEAGQAIATVPATLPGDLPSDLLQRRPDIRAAERRLAAATARTGAAQADWYPRFSLQGDIGLASAALGSLPNAASRTWSIGPSLSWPILRAGQITATVAVRDAEQQAALLAYRQAILMAMEEVEDALATYRHEQLQHARLLAAVVTARDRVALAQSNFDGGMSDFRSVLAVNQSLGEAQKALVHSDIALATEWIAIHKALGGDWCEGGKACVTSH